MMNGFARLRFDFIIHNHHRTLAFELWMATSTCQLRLATGYNWHSLVIAASSTSANFALSSPTPPNTNISDLSISASCHSSNTASFTTPQHPTTYDDNGGGIECVSR
eukprot:scaffold63107_cov81-Cyclotella_meneghiniana.AAC.8